MERVPLSVVQDDELVAVAVGSGRRSTPLTTLKMAVLAPIPSAIVMMTVSAKPELRRRLRTP